MSKLAIEGGSKAVTNTLIGWPQFDEKAISAVTEILRSGKVNYWTGKKGMGFAKKLAVRNEARSRSFPSPPSARKACTRLRKPW